jgi:hypothetical protein
MTGRAQGIQISHGQEDIVIGFGRNVQRAASGGEGLGSRRTMPMLRIEARARHSNFLYLFGRRGDVQFRAEGFHLIGWQCPQEAFQKYFGLAKASIEIIVMAFESLPGVIRVHGLGSGQVIGFRIELADETLERLRKNTKFLKKAGAVRKQNAVEKLVPGGRALRGLAFEKFCVEGQDLWNVVYVAATIRNRLAGFNQDHRGAREQIGGNGDLKPGTDQLSPEPQRKSFIQGDTGHGVRGFPTAHDDVEEVGFVAR